MIEAPRVCTIHVRFFPELHSPFIEVSLKLLVVPASDFVEIETLKAFTVRRSI